MTPYKYQAELDVFREAERAAIQAAQDHINANLGVWYPCGFAWVRIRPARGRFVEMCKDRDFGRTDDFEGGFVIYNPSNNPTQWMDAKEAGARAFAEVLKKHYPTMKVRVETRID
jgi:hypothetical protein